MRKVVEAEKKYLELLMNSRNLDEELKLEMRMKVGIFVMEYVLEG